MATIKLPALRIEQFGRTMYATTLRAGFLAEADGLTKPDAWSQTNRQGYQRWPVESRFKKIAKHIIGTNGNRGTLPGAILLNSRRPLKFKALDGHPDIGWLEIPEEALPLWEVDGQHRIGGVRVAVQEYPELADYAFPVVILENVSRIEEALTFFVINTMQKRVPTDLAQRLVAQQADDPELRKQVVGEGQVWIKTATEVVDLINEEGDTVNPWFNRIGIPGVRNPGVLMRQVSFVSSLKPLLDSQSVYAALQPERIAKLLLNYWGALSDVFPAAFAEHDKYVIQNTVGVFPLHNIAPTVFELVRGQQGKISRDGIREVLQPMAEYLQREYGKGEDDSDDPSNFWLGDGGEAGKYAGAKGFRIITDILKVGLEGVRERQGAELVLVE
jgi:DGQHR domain-containing protein